MRYIAIHTVWRGSPLEIEARTAVAHEMEVHENKVLQQLPVDAKVIEDRQLEVGYGALVTYGWTYYVKAKLCIS